MTAPRIAVISNPHSGWNKTHLQKLDAVLQDYPHVPHYVTADHDALYDALSACREQRVRTLPTLGPRSCSGRATAAATATATAMPQSRRG